MKLIPNNVSNKIGHSLLVASKNSPRLMFVTGLVGVGVSTVLACRATLKLNDNLDEFKHKVDDSKQRSELLQIDGRRELVPVYVSGTVEIAKLYAPAVIVGVVSVGLLTGSHVTLSRRNASLTAAYSAVAMSYEKYRERVRAQLGEEKELELYRGVHTENVDLDGDGKMKKIPVISENGLPPYAKLFNPQNYNWKPSQDANQYFLAANQRWANDLLHSRGHVFLNEVYEQLGFEHTSAGAVVGWISERHGGKGDNYIDFGLYQATNADYLLAGWEPSIVLNFNVDGTIYDKLG